MGVVLRFDEFVNEQVGNKYFKSFDPNVLDKKYLYHAISDLEDLPSILSNGLKPKNFNGIFLSDSQDYNERCTALLGLELNDKNLEKYDISYHNKSVSISYKPINPSDIELIDCRIGDGSYHQHLMASKWMEFKIMDKPVDKLSVFCKNIGAKLFYEDVCEYFFGVEKTRKLKELNIQLKKLGI